MARLSEESEVRMKKQENIMHPQHHYCSKLHVKDLNEHLMCVLCGGYFVDATTIIECLHSFCRTCIVQYLESSKYCPICDVQVHKTRPLLNIRADKTLQDLVYKLIPGLFDEEMRRRREFLKAHPEVKTNRMDLEQRGQALMVPVHSLPSKHISLVLEMAATGWGPQTETKRSTQCSKKSADRRYLLCPSDVNVRILKKFLRCKFNLPEKFQVDLFYTTSEESISDDFTLLDLTFIYSWNRDKPFHLYYTIYEKPRRKRRLLTDRLSQRHQSQAKKARMESADENGAGANRQLCKSSVETPSSVAAVNKGKTPAFCSSVSKPKQKTQITKEFWKLHSREKLKIKKKALENVKKTGRGVKQNLKSTNMQAKSDYMDSTRPKANGKSPANHLLSGKALSSSSSDCGNDKALDVKTTPKGKRPSSPSVLNNMLDKESCSRLATANGVHKLSHTDSRSASPRLSSANSSRSASPRQSTAAAGKTNLSESPRPKVKSSPKGSSTKDNAKLTNGKDMVKVWGGRDVSRPCSRGSSRTESPRPAEVQHSIQTGVFPSLPVGEKITVDVSMTVSETSSDVTSPGAEDRANSTGLEETGDFDRSGGHVCNVATFVSQPLPTLVHVPSNGHKPTPDKGNGRRQSQDKGNGHKQNFIQENEFKQNASKNNGQRPGMNKVNGNGHSLNLNKDHAYKTSVNKACQVKEATKSSKTSSLVAKSGGKTQSNKKR